jgi:hypothetical protein
MGKTVDDSDSIKQRAVRKQKRREARNNASSFPSSVVCTAQGLAASKNSIEVGLVVSLMIVFLYVYGIWNSIQVLPMIETGFRRGANLNIPNLLHTAAKSNHMEQVTEVVGTNKERHVQRLDQQMAKTQEAPGADAGVALVAPKAIWPVRFERERENNEFETIIHPGDNTTPMQVPRFWSSPMHSNQQYTREQAMQIGSCIEPDPVSGSFQRGDECPMDKRTIFIAIASYRDFQCRYTVESAFNRAKHPERIRVGKEE